MRDSEPVAPIKYFYIDKTGKKVLEGQGYYGDSFKEGLALVCDRMADAKSLFHDFRYIDHAGKTRIKLSAYEAHPFSEGVACIEAKVPFIQGSCTGYIDKNAHWVIKPEFHDFGDSYSDGLTLRATPGKWKLQYVDHSGQQKIDIEKKLGPSFPRRNLHPFSEGLAQITVGNVYLSDPKSLPPKFGYIDKEGNWKIPPGDLKNEPFCEGLARTYRINEPYKDPHTQYIDPEGKAVLTVPYKGGNFSEGVCAVSRGGLTGYCDRQGKIVIKPQFENGREFSEGLAAVRMNGKLGYIDHTGAFVIHPQFAIAGDFSEGVAVVVPFEKQGDTNSIPRPLLWGEPSGKYFAREGIKWQQPESTDPSD